MKTLFFFICWQCVALAQDSSDEIYRLYNKNRFVEMEQRNQDRSHPHYFFYKAVFANVCNRPDQSNLYLDSLANMGIPDKIGYLFWTLRNDNFVKLFRYADAAATGDTLLRRYDTLFTAQNITDLKNVTNIWRAAKDVPPPDFASFAVLEMPYIRDETDLISIEVENYDTTVRFIFDTGAGMCTISETMAKTLDFQFLESQEVSVGGYTDVENKVRIAVAPALFLGNVCIKNMLFLVVNDAALSFGSYRVHGIIGLPVAKSMGTVIISKDSLVFQPGENCAVADKNLFIDFLHPIVSLQFAGRNLPFGFDTGASQTTFSAPFYYTFKKALKRIGGKYRWAEFASVGGSKAYRVFVVKQLSLNLGKQPLVFEQLMIEKDAPHPVDKDLHGNIGQDILQKYRRVHISFDGNYLKLED